VVGDPVSEVRRRRRSWALVLLLILAGLAIAGCGSSSSDSGASGKEIKLGYVQPYSEPYSSQVAAGMKAAAARYGATVTVTGPDTIDPSKEVAALQNLVTTGIDGVLVHQTDPELFARPIEAAIDQGVDVNTVTEPSEESGTNFTVGQPFHGIGAGVAAAFNERLGPDASGTAYVGICSPGIPAVEAVGEGFEAELKQASPNLTVEDVATATTPPENFAAWQRIAAQHPDAIGFYGICGLDVNSLVKLKEQNPDSKWLTGSEGGEDPLTAQAVEHGDLTAAVFQRPFVQGYVGATLMLEHLVDGKPEPKGWINTGYDVLTRQNATEIEKAATSTSAAMSYYGRLINKLIAEPATKQPQESQVTEANPPNLDPDGNPVGH
jgi:ABC-type sugar transport system substrate-binding protein